MLLQTTTMSDGRTCFEGESRVKFDVDWVSTEMLSTK